jgi:hypothetical protein
MRQEAVHRLEALGTELAKYDFSCQVVVPRGTPVFARVVNKAAPQLRDDVSCFSEEGDERLYFWWSWGEPIAPAAEIFDVITKIVYVLTPSDS